jgi:transglutaminase-like putative cysteine protease
MSAAKPLALAHPLSPEQRVMTPRDLVWLTASLLLVTAPHALRAPWWLTVLALCLYGWRFYCTLNRAPLPARWLVLAFAAAGMLGVWLEYRTLFGRQSGVVMLMLFSGLKLLESRTHRDAAIAAFLGYFLIITNFLYSQSIPTAAAMAVGLYALTATLVGFSAPQRPAAANLRSAALLLLHAVPAAVALFLFFPRVEGPLWGLPRDAYSGMTGLSDTMSPGNLSELALSDAIAFRAAFEGEPPPPAARYWRGPVLWDFDGRTWSGAQGGFPPFSAPQGQGRYRYTVVLEPHNRPWLFALESAARVPENARMSFDGQLYASSPVRNRLLYDMVSVTNPAPRDEEAPRWLARALRLPAGFNPRARALAARWREGAASDADVLARAIAFLQQGRYVYTLDPPLLGTNSVDEFLFDTREGFCEHFSSAFTFLMRAAGIPARVVTGYQGGEVNGVDRIVTVRQSDAHAWSEVYLRGRGWVRVDPTAAAMPTRVQAGLVRALPQTAHLPLMLRPEMEWLRHVRSRWEALAHRWNVWVLAYNPERQRELMLSLGLRGADWRDMTATLFTVLGVLTLGLLAWSLRRIARPDPVQKAWQRFCAKLAARGIERASHEGPRDYSARAARALPGSRRAILRIASLYIALRYGSRTSRAGAERLKRLVRQLELA